MISVICREEESGSDMDELGEESRLEETPRNSILCAAVTPPHWQLNSCQIESKRSEGAYSKSPLENRTSGTEFPVGSQLSE